VIDEWMYGRMNRMDGCMVGMNGWGGWIYDCMNGVGNGWIVEWMNGWMVE